MYLILIQILFIIVRTQTIKMRKCSPRKSPKENENLPNSSACDWNLFGILNTIVMDSFVSLMGPHLLHKLWQSLSSELALPKVVVAMRCLMARGAM